MNWLIYVFECVLTELWFVVLQLGSSVGIHLIARVWIHFNNHLLENLLSWIWESLFYSRYRLLTRTCCTNTSFPQSIQVVRDKWWLTNLAFTQIYAPSLWYVSERLLRWRLTWRAWILNYLFLFNFFFKNRLIGYNALLPRLPCLGWLDLASKLASFRLILSTVIFRTIWFYRIILSTWATINIAAPSLTLPSTWLTEQIIQTYFALTIAVLNPSWF